VIIKIHVAGIFDDKPVFVEGEIELKDDALLRDLFKKADKALGFKDRKYLRQVLSMAVPPTVLLNGDRLDLPEGFGHGLKDGDEVSLLSPIAGG